MLEHKSSSSVPLPSGPYAVYVPSDQISDSDPPARTVPLSFYLGIIRRQIWKVLPFIALCMIAAILISSRMQPIYQSTAVIYIDREVQSGVVGKESSEMGVSNDGEQFIATQVQLIQSNSVLRPVIEKYHLFESQRPRSDKASKNARVQPETSISLPGLKVKRQPNTYLVDISYRSDDRQKVADVANAVANSYIQHTFWIRTQSSASLSAFMEKQVNELRAKVERSTRLGPISKRVRCYRPAG